eukprot:16428062-Heterocapsa_arctica.AAC.1
MWNEQQAMSLKDSKKRRRRSKDQIFADEYDDDVDIDGDLDNEYEPSISEPSSDVADISDEDYGAGDVDDDGDDDDDNNGSSSDDGLIDHDDKHNHPEALKAKQNMSQTQKQKKVGCKLSAVSAVLLSGCGWRGSSGHEGRL